MFMYLSFPVVSMRLLMEIRCLSLSLYVDVGDRRRLVGEERVQGMNVCKVVHVIG